MCSTIHSVTSQDLVFNPLRICFFNYELLSLLSSFTIFKTFTTNCFYYKLKLLQKNRHSKSSLRHIILVNRSWCESHFNLYTCDTADYKSEVFFMCYSFFTVLSIFVHFWKHLSHVTFHSFFYIHIEILLS